MKILNLSCGSRNVPEFDKHELVRLDINEEVKPDIVWDLNKHPLPFKDEEFDQVHAYDVLEHLGKQGDYKFFFSEFNEYWRILKPNGLFVASVPAITSGWVFGDPGHTRVFSRYMLIFLDQNTYSQCGTSQLTDYRFIYKGNFKTENIMYPQYKEYMDSMTFVLRKIDE